MSIGFEYEPLSAEYWADPYPIYRKLRDDAPLYCAPETGTYCLSRHEDAAFALRHPELFTSGTMQKVLMGGGDMAVRFRDIPAIARFLVRTRANPLRVRRPPPGLINTDPPYHDRLRSVVNRGFTPRRIEGWAERMREIVRDLMGSFRRGEAFDVIHDLAVPLPVTVIAEMLGVEPERERDFKRWSDMIVSAATGGARGQGIGARLEPLGQLRGYVREIVRARRETPGDDLISVLVDPSLDPTLSDDEVFGFIILLLVAGNETTTNLIGNATLALLDHPDELRKVQAAPDLLPGAIEETLRWNAPVQLLFRGTTRDVQLPSGKLPAGSDVCVMLGSANRDERVFEDPDRYRVQRDTSGHLGFGFGVHFCLGASLARLEAKTAMEALVPELPRVRREPVPELVDSFLVRGPRRLELEARA